MFIADNDLRDPTGFLPLSPQDFQVLLVLTERPLHGYGIVKASEDETGSPRLELGSLYRIINRLSAGGLVEEVTGPDAGSKRKRRSYAATEFGRSVARAEARRLSNLLNTKHALDLLEG